MFGGARGGQSRCRAPPLRAGRKKERKKKKKKERQEKIKNILVVYKAQAKHILQFLPLQTNEALLLLVEGLFNCTLFIFHVFSCSLTQHVECLRKIILAFKSVALNFPPFNSFLKVMDCLFVPSELAGRTSALEKGLEPRAVTLKL